MGITRGVLSIAMGAVAVDGGPGTALTTLGKTDASATNSFTQDDPTETNYESLEDDDPVDVETTPGARNLNFTILDPTPANMVRVLGGTLSGSAPNQTWNAPANIPSIEQTVVITPRKGLALTIVRGKVTAKINHDLSKNGGKLAIDVSVRVLVPTKEGVSPAMYGPAA
jgi:hypothetical protein